MSKILQTKQILLGIVCLVVFVGLGLFFLREKRQDQARDKSSGQRALMYKVESEHAVRKKIQNGEFKRKYGTEESEYFRSYFEDQDLRAVYLSTIEFFEGQKFAQSAGMFFAFSMVFDSNPERLNLMKSAIAEIKKNSEEIYKFLETKNVADYQFHPYFHSRVLNLVHQTELSPEKKLNLYSRTLEKPIELNEAGQLEDGSLSFETALILTKQSGVGEDLVANVIEKALKVNQDPQQISSIKERVITYNPRLSYLFE